MEYKIDQYSHKLSLENNISYEEAYNLMDNELNKLNNNISYNNPAEYVYKKIKKIKGGDNKYYKYIKYKSKYIHLKGANIKCSTCNKIHKYNECEYII